MKTIEPASRRFSAHACSLAPVAAATRENMLRPNAPQSRRLTLIASVLLSTAFAPWGCASTVLPECQVGADCASGVCSASGQCAPVSTVHTDGGAPSGADGSTTAPPDGGIASLDAGGPTRDSGISVGLDSGGSTNSDSGTHAPVDGGASPWDSSTAASDAGSPESDDASSGLCTPTHDGTIAEGEVPMMPGLHANFLIAENVTVDSAGTTLDGGDREWDLSVALSGDHTVLVTTNAPTGQWFSSAFPSATHTTTLSDTSTLLGILQGTPGALLLQGVASPASGNSQTELTYNPPATMIALPMTLGSTWTSNSEITGTADGLVANYFEQYVSKVDAEGTLKIPYGTFHVLRVQTTLTRTVGGVPTLTQSFSFVAECFGPIASLTSQSGETETEFTNAAEARRLTP